MSRLRLNPLTGRWVTISAERAARPSALAPRSLPVEAPPGAPCPFGRGRDDGLPPPPIETYGSDGDWQVRVVPNRYPAFSGTDPMVVRNLGPVFSEASASGLHEVLVLTQDHRASWADLADRQAGVVMAAL